MPPEHGGRAAATPRHELYGIRALPVGEIFSRAGAPGKKYCVAFDLSLGAQGVGPRSATASNSEVQIQSANPPRRLWERQFALLPRILKAYGVGGVRQAPENTSRRHHRKHWPTRFERPPVTAQCSWVDTRSRMSQLIRDGDVFWDIRGKKPANTNHEHISARALGRFGKGRLLIFLGADRRQAGDKHPRGRSGVGKEGRPPETICGYFGSLDELYCESASESIG